MTIDARKDGSFIAEADLTPVYGGNPALTHWKRKLDFQSRVLTVSDRFATSPGTRAIFQVNVPERPRIDGNQATAGRLRLTVMEPANASLTAYQWNTKGSNEFRSGWRIDVTGAVDGYVVRLEEM
jgi:hypothetical protein